MRLIHYPRGYPASKLKLPSPTDYFDFPASLLAFAESLPTSQLMSVENEVYFRRRNQQLTLITYYCDDIRLRSILATLQIDGFKIKFLNYVNKPMGAFDKVSYGKEYYTTSDWAIGDIICGMSGHESYQLRKALRKGIEDYRITHDVAPTEVAWVFEQWYTAAKKRHFMVVRGHYLRYIERFYADQRSAYLVGLRRNSDDVLAAIGGFELYQGDAQLTLAKHVIGDNNLARYFWITMINVMIELGANKLYMGSTADDLKQQLGLSSYQSYKLRLP